jgi:hypothetical protein
MWWESVAGLMPVQLRSAAGERVRPIAQGLRDQKNLILRQRFASRFRHPHTFEMTA